MRRHKSFQKYTPNQWKSANTQTNQILSSSQRINSNTHSSKLCHCPLHTKTQYCNEQKERIIEEPFEHVILFILKLPRIDLVKQLHKDKSLENHCVNLNFVSRIVQSDLLAWVSIDVGLICVERCRLVKGELENSATEEQHTH